MMRKALLAAALVWTAACGDDADEAAFRAGLPSRQSVEVKTPEARGQALSVNAKGEGERAAFYTLTRSATVNVNGGTVAMLTLLEQVTKHPATTVDGDVAVWGPYTDALSPNAWKLTVTRQADRNFSYAFEGKPRDADDSAFVRVLSGTHLASPDASGAPRQGYGSGAFLIDWDAARTLPEHDDQRGTGEITYARVDEVSDTTVAMSFTQVRNDAGALVDGEYRYRATPAQGGQFEFSVDQDSDDAGTALEHVTVKSRWEESGAGRSDAKVSGGDFATEQTINECWDTGFDSRYFAASFSQESGYGEAATNCASFTSADYSAL